MREEYDIMKLNPRPNPYIHGRKTVSITLEKESYEKLKAKEEKTGIPMAVLIARLIDENI